MRNHEYLYSVNLYDDKNKRVAKKIEEIATVKKFLKDEYIFMFRDKVDFIYIIKSGVVTIYGIDNSYNEKILFLLNRGSIINDDVLVNNETSTSANVFEDCTLLCIEKSQLFNLMSEDVEVMEFMFKSSTNKLTRVYRQLKNSGTTIGIDKKLCSKLWKLSKDYGYKTDLGIVINVNINTIFLSKMLGTTRETISRNITKLVKEDILLLDQSKIVIRDIDKLVEYIRDDSK